MVPVGHGQDPHLQPRGSRDMQLDAPEARRAGAELLSPRVADDLRRILPRVSRKEMATEDLAALRRLRDLAGWE